jgi:alkylation response protein AidB-like acyl-CoA dehydrogenase
MDFEFSDEQQQLHDSIGRYLSEQYGFDKFRAVAASAAGWDRTVWAELAELGVLGINVPSEHGGLGFGPLETLAMMGLCGRSLTLEPVLSSAVISTAALNACGSSPAAADLLGDLARGSRIAVLAHFESGSRFDTQWVTARARRSGESYLLEGHKAVVLHANAADVLLVSARSSGEAPDAAGVSLFAVPRDTPGVRLDVYSTIDEQRAADIYLKDVEVPGTSLLGKEGGAFAAIDAALDTGLAALCAEAVGVMQALLDATVQYLQTRQQFGQPIGRFQALQHRIADMVVHLEQARSMSYLAALRCSDKDSSQRRKALSAAKVVVGQAARFIAQQAVQLHGGMGMTDELIVSHYFKRLTAAEIMFGDADSHLQRFASLTR